MKDYQKIYYLFKPDKKAELFLLLFASIGMAIMQTAGIASILPFVAVISSPELIHTNKFLSSLYEFLNFTTQNNYLIFLGICTMIVLITSNIFSAFATKAILRFTYLQGHRLSQRLFRQYLSRPYTFFLNRNTADFAKNIITEVDRCIQGILTPTLNILSRLIITVCIIILLTVIDPLLAILVFLVCGCSYALVYKVTRRSLNIYGKKSAASQSLRNKIVSEAFGGIKDLKLLGREGVFLQLYSDPSYNFAKTQSQRQTIAELPKYALETIIFGGILLIILYFIGIKENIGGILPLLSLYAFAGYRLMPALQRIFAGLTALRFHMPVFDIIYTDIYEITHSPKNLITYQPENSPLQFNGSLILHDVTFKYPQSKFEIIQELNLKIQANTTVGFVGQTGSGKTTLIDIILGLLPIENGEILIDGTCINQDNARNWQKNIGYVPQHIYLADDSISNNIAFGIPYNEVDHQAVTRAAQIARLDDFVKNSLPEGFDTIIGERGVRLSGGQRQRIGIARALYHDPEVLILDEATSALDGATENSIMDAIHNLSQKKTIIMIAHRITTVKECNVIHVMEKGEIIESGTYEELIGSNEQFREMANVSSSTVN